jgi:CHAD domain-containing protein
MKELLKPFVRKQLKFLEHLQEAIPSRISNDWVHDLRLAHKKLRTAYLLMEWLSPDELSAKKLWKPFKNLHEASGAYRDVCVMQSYFQKKYESFPELTDVVLHFLSIREAEYHEALVYQLKKLQTPDKKEIRKNFKTIDEVKKNKEVMELINLYSHEIISAISRSLITRSIADETYHTIRRGLKTLYYTIRLVRKEDHKDRLLIEPKWCKPIAELLGDWHDRVNVGIVLEQLVLEEDLDWNATLSAQLIGLREEINLEKEHFIKAFHRGFEYLITEIEEKL